MLLLSKFEAYHSYTVELYKSAGLYTVEYGQHSLTSTNLAEATDEYFSCVRHSMECSNLLEANDEEVTL